MPHTNYRRPAGRILVACAGAALVALSGPGLRAQGVPTAPVSQGPLPTVRQPVTVVASKEPAPADRVAASVTAVSGDTIDAAGLATVSDASILAPNTFYSDLSARKISNARFRGIGSSPANPGITTFVDGVPQLNTNSANFDLLDVEQVEFVRGAQSALFGRNTLGGVVNVTSRRPSLSAWHGWATVPLGSHSDQSVQAGFEGPLVTDRLGASFSVGLGGRDGFSTNSVTGHTLDDRSAFAAKGQLHFKTGGRWQGNVVVSGERDRDGDYTLGDLASIRTNPFTVARDFEGHTDRDLVSTAFVARREGAGVNFTTTTGVVHWRTFDETDLDYTPYPAAIRSNDEAATQFTEEVRFSSSRNSPLRVSSAATLAWQAGVFLFTNSYDQDAINQLAPFVLSPDLPVAVDIHSPQSSLDDGGVGVFGQGTVTFHQRVDVSAGVRVDWENREAILKSFLDPSVAAGNTVEGDRTFSSVSPQLAVSFRPRDGQSVYASVGKGFKAGGFNPASPPGSEEYGEEEAWHTEGGIKMLLAGDRLAVSAAVFYIDWNNIQLNLPNPFVAAQFYIGNAGEAASSGFEVEAEARVHDKLNLFGAAGLTHARFKTDSTIAGVSLSDNKIPLTPDYTAMMGAEFTHTLQESSSLFARAELVGYGGFEYDDLNSARQDAYMLTNLRAGVRRARFFVEAWVRNAFSTKYVPVAFTWFDPNAAPSGFLGEPGKPRTFGIRAGVGF